MRLGWVYSSQSNSSRWYLGDKLWTWHKTWGRTERRLHAALHSISKDNISSHLKCIYSCYWTETMWPTIPPCCYSHHLKREVNISGITACLSCRQTDIIETPLWVLTPGSIKVAEPLWTTNTFNLMKTESLKCACFFCCRDILFLWLLSCTLASVWTVDQ